ncbi:MAG: hypothetical protein RIC80_08685 [Cyclobacteriaceae bacterium]
MENKSVVQPWMRGVLLLAGIYNLAWGLFIYNFPEAFISWLSQGAIVAAGPIIGYQGLGVLLLAGVFLWTAIYFHKLGYLIWVTIGFKLAGGPWTFYMLLDGLYTKRFLFHLIMNDLIWVIPLTIIALKWTRVKAA